MTTISNAFLTKVQLDSLETTAHLAKKIAPVLEAGDILLLRGTLGVGKTTFARDLIQAYFKDDDLLVQSPTFTLCQVYDGSLSKSSIWHFDFYRLVHSEEIFEVGYEEAQAGGIIVIEWPEKMGGYCPTTALELVFSLEREKRMVQLYSDLDKWQKVFT